ncbi:hypothetical protein ALT_9002 [Aspergillus lentulus]|uniref:FAD dependent oxidoreductase domain-containing protein n=1 Tax=Aspergillus lentulus TaxID=293939 RepID=A0AAN4PT20_ASPLE|nr:hypothetical protein ALT_9002 [Aspergillus lentulus]
MHQGAYDNITVFDQGAQIPADHSAANDLNKIKALDAWKAPLFAPYFHQTGFLHCVSGDAPDKAIQTLKRFETAATNHPVLGPHVAPLSGREDICRWFLQADGHLPGWKGYINKFDGTKVGRFHAAELVIVAVGAAAAKLVPEIGTQLVAKSWSVAHVRLSGEKTSALRGIPVTYARDLEFYFEPDPQTNLLKLCCIGGGYINTDPTTGVSHALESLETSAFMPHEDESRVRRLLAQTLHTKDSDFIIDYVPNTASSVVLLSGDSGHVFF